MILVSNIPANTTLNISPAPYLAVLAPILKEQGFDLLLRIKLGKETFTIDAYGSSWNLSLTPFGMLYARLSMETLVELSQLVSDHTTCNDTHIHHDFEILVQSRGVTGDKLCTVYERSLGQAIQYVMDAFYTNEDMERISAAACKAIVRHYDANKGLDPKAIPIIVGEIAKTIIEQGSEYKFMMARTNHDIYQFALVTRKSSGQPMFFFQDGVFMEVESRPGGYVTFDVNLDVLKDLPNRYEMLVE